MSLLPNHPEALKAASPLLRHAVHDRIVGALIGSALGDAIGLYTEFLTSRMATQAYPSCAFTLFPTPTPFWPDAHRLQQQLGDWTDDTDHALLILLSYLNHGDLRPRDLAHRLKIWVDMGLRPLDTLPLGLGALVGSIVATPGYVEHPEQVARAKWEASGRNAAPNGSLMRTHPLGLMCLFKDENDTFQVAAEYSKLTHVDPRCVLSCVIGTGLIRGVVRGEIRQEEDLDALVGKALRWYQAQPQEGKLDVQELQRHTSAKSLADLKLDEEGKIGYVYKTLGSGVLLLRRLLRKERQNHGALAARAQVFEQLVTELVMEAGDADTNACFAGALLGGYLGYAALPGHWKHGLRHERWIMDKAEGLAQMLGAVDGMYDGQLDADTRLDGGRGFLTKVEMRARWVAHEREIAKRAEKVRR